MIEWPSLKNQAKYSKYTEKTGVGCSTLIKQGGIVIDKSFEPCSIQNSGLLKSLSVELLFACTIVMNRLLV